MAVQPPAYSRSKLIWVTSCIFSILLPVFASYKALRTGDPAVTTPWLMYWTTLSLFLLVENQLYFILYWVPFYAWIRLGLHLYLVAPGKQGSVFIYQQHIQPFLDKYDRQIDVFISLAHDKAKAAGLGYINQLIELVSVKVLGQAPKQPSPVPSRNVSYTTHLMNRFAMPAAREGFGGGLGGLQGLAGAGTSDVFSLLGKVMQQSSNPESTSRSAQADDLSRSGNLIPPSLTGNERRDFVDTQRERLQTLLQAFDNEASYPADRGPTTSSQPRSEAPRRPSSRKSYLAPGEGDYMHKSRSESEFEDLAYEPMPDPADYRNTGSGERRPPSSSKQGSSWGGVGNMIWGNYGEKDSAARDSRKYD